MDLATYVAKARPGVMGGQSGEKRPLRERITLPVKRHIFIDKDSHPEAQVYIAIHEARDLPETVPDYQVPHLHNTDEFYFFLGNEPDLSGLEGQIKFEGRVHKIVAPATVYIPTGAVHEYKVTRGSGGVVVLFRDRGYDHVDRQPDIEKGNREADKFASHILKAEVRPTTEIRYHRDTAPGKRYVFIDGKKMPEAEFYTVVRTVSDVKPTQVEYVDKHTHNCDTYHILIGTGSDLSGLKAGFVIGEEEVVVESPVGVHVPAGVPHSQRLMEGSGHFFNIVPKGDYNDSLI
jgi:mannose-6-phosphate isomerase-like protein (cupin superfamily)